MASSFARSVGVPIDGVCNFSDSGPGSAADLDGQLAVGDRICQLDGQSIAELTPAQVIDKLKAAVDRVTITVKRTSLSQS